MNFKPEDIQKIANLAKLHLNDAESEKYTAEMENIFTLIDEMNQIDTTDIAPMYNPHDMTLRLRDDIVSEENQRDSFQQLAPQAESGLYLVPKVIE